MLNSHIHRVWLTDDNDVPTGVVSTTDLLCLILPNALKTMHPEIIFKHGVESEE